MRRVAGWAAWCIGMLVVCEVVLRVFYPLHLAGIQDAYQFDQDLGYRPRPGIHLLETTDHQQEIRTNALGTVNFEEDLASYGQLVFALGDSNTQGTGVPSDASYPFQLAMILNAGKNGEYRRDFGVVNLGLAAYGAVQSRLVLERYSKLLGTPQVALYLGSDNDYQDDQLFLSGYQHGHLVEGNPHWGWWLRPIGMLNSIEISKRIKVLISSYRRSRIVSSPCSVGGCAAESDWEHIQGVVAACRKRGTRVILSWSKYPSDSYRWLQARAASEALPFADWGPSVAAVQKAIPALPSANPHSAKHHRTWVNRLVAESFAREIQSRAGDDDRRTSDTQAETSAVDNP